MKAGIVIVMAGWCSLAYCQMSDAPKPQPQTEERILFAMDAAARAADVWTTHQLLKNPSNHEMIFPEFVVRHSLLICFTESGIEYGLYQSSGFLDRHHHHRLALSIPIIDMIAVGLTDWHNSTLPTNAPTERKLLK